mmetsp:Transcript_84391/g.239235  ORF Transcript_84391/g.239235 Transcript_84391/m.239235 type:complete len:241 (+) Transcript_84391:2975-3697(+)
MLPHKHVEQVEPDCAGDLLRDVHLLPDSLLLVLEERQARHLHGARAHGQLPDLLGLPPGHARDPVGRRPQRLAPLPRPRGAAEELAPGHEDAEGHQDHRRARPARRRRGVHAAQALGVAATGGRARAGARPGRRPRPHGLPGPESQRQARRARGQPPRQARLVRRGPRPGLLRLHALGPGARRALRPGRGLQARRRVRLRRRGAFGHGAADPGPLQFGPVPAELQRLLPPLGPHGGQRVQ